MKVVALYTKNNPDPFINLTFVDWQFDFEGRTIQFTAPKEWSALAVEILWSKFARKKGVAPLGYESCARQIFKRLAHTWRLWGERLNYFDSTEDASIFEREILFMLAHQIAAPNSPQWFNTGLFDVYGIKGDSPEGHFAYDFERQEVAATSGAFVRPQAHACFIQSVSDELITEGGIYDLLLREARLFKYGSGTGSNFSHIRGRGELLAGGGISSGLMSFLDVFDRSAGVIQSGGTTRRAAKMVCLDADHPDVLDFVRYKKREEDKVAMLILGSQAAHHHFEALKSSPPSKRAQVRAELAELGVSESILLRYEEMIRNKITPDFPIFNTDWEGEAYKSVSGQNANFSLRLKEDFFQALENKSDWALTARTTGEVMRTLKAADLWHEILNCAWASADPGVQFHDTINDWNTCAQDGEIRASNPCSEYMFLDETACNLASLNLIKFLDEKNNFMSDHFVHSCELWTMVLDISVSLASYPSLMMAKNGMRYRTLGLGFANLGSLLMAQGLAYDSDEGRAQAGVISALMSGAAYSTSSRLAAQLGAFPAYEANKESMLRVLSQHEAALVFDRERLDHLKHTPYFIRKDLVASELYERACTLWQEVLKGAAQHGVRNAQVSVIAPTGTIGLMMDCDTTGIEPEFSLVKFKKLSGGRSVKIVNQTTERALKTLGLAPAVIQEIIESILNDEADLSRWLTPLQLPIFDCALATKYNQMRMISSMGHLKMMACVQPFISGAISKTVNMSYESTPADIGRIYLEARQLMLKAVAVYRDGSKLGQPLMRAQAVICSECGLKGLISTGSCFVCPNCGTSTGCS